MDELNEDKGERWRWDECSMFEYGKCIRVLVDTGTGTGTGTGTSTDFIRFSILLNPIGEQLNSCQGQGFVCSLAEQLTDCWDQRPALELC